jgi:4-amino-4-deoxy-L-arabinose transferase-like glycosyltransferase
MQHDTIHPDGANAPTDLSSQLTAPAILPFHLESLWLAVCLSVLFLLAALIRLDDMRTPGHLLDREYTSAIFARAFYYANNDRVEAWQRDIAVTAKEQQPVLEPPALDYMVSLIYRIIGREELYFARYLTGAFWLAGGVFMFLVARKLLSTPEAVVATAYYLFVPMGIIISRSFQPDSLMYMLFLITLYAEIRYFEAPTPKRLLVAASSAGITLLLRPLALFAIFGAFLALSFYRSKDWKRLIDFPLIIFSAISLLPAAIYYGYGILFAGFMRWKIATSFMPHLLIKQDFWLGWFANVVDVAEFAPLALAVAGFFLLKQQRTRYLVVALTAAFVVYSVAFTYHIHTHPYYHIQLFPVVALCMAPVVVKSIQLLSHAIRRVWWVPVAVIALLTFFVAHREVRANLYSYRMEDPVVAQEIGEIIHHSARTVYVAFYYGLPLGYYGEFGGAPWPVAVEDEFYRRPGERTLSVEERLGGLGFVPEYFVITHFDLFNRKHQDLKAYLAANCTIHAQTDQYLIYDSCRRIIGSGSLAVAL